MSNLLASKLDPLQLNWSLPLDYQPTKMGPDPAQDPAPKATLRKRSVTTLPYSAILVDSPSEELPEAELSGDQATPRPKRHWVQDVQVNLVRHSYDLAKTGVFEGRQPAQAIFQYYIFNTAIHDSAPRRFRQGYVMPGCTFPASVKKATSWSDEAVRKANAWLHQQRLIGVSDIQADGERSIEILSYDGESEQSRLKALAEGGQATALALKRGPRSKRSGKTAAEDAVSTVSGDTSTVSGITAPPISTDVDTYYSDLPAYPSDADRAEQPAPAARAASTGQSDQEKEVEEAAARPRADHTALAARNRARYTELV